MGIGNLSKRNNAVAEAAAAAADGGADEGREAAATPVGATVAEATPTAAPMTALEQGLAEKLGGPFADGDDFLSEIPAPPVAAAATASAAPAAAAAPTFMTLGTPGMPKRAVEPAKPEIEDMPAAPAGDGPVASADAEDVAAAGPVEGSTAAAGGPGLPESVLRRLERERQRVLDSDLPEDEKRKQLDFIDSRLDAGVLGGWERLRQDRELQEKALASQREAMRDGGGGGGIMSTLFSALRGSAGSPEKALADLNRRQGELTASTMREFDSLGELTRDRIQQWRRGRVHEAVAEADRSLDAVETSRKGIDAAVLGSAAAATALGGYASANGMSYADLVGILNRGERPEGALKALAEASAEIGADPAVISAQALHAENRERLLGDIGRVADMADMMADGGALDRDAAKDAVLKAADIAQEAADAPGSLLDGEGRKDADRRFREMGERFAENIRLLIQRLMSMFGLSSDNDNDGPAAAPAYA